MQNAATTLMHFHRRKCSGRQTEYKAHMEGRTSESNLVKKDTNTNIRVQRLPRESTTGVRDGSAFLEKLFACLGCEGCVARTTFTSSQPPRVAPPISIKLGCRLLAPAEMRRKRRERNGEMRKVATRLTAEARNAERGISGAGVQRSAMVYSASANGLRHGDADTSREAAHDHGHGRRSAGNPEPGTGNRVRERVFPRGPGGTYGRRKPYRDSLFGCSLARWRPSLPIAPSAPALPLPSVDHGGTQGRTRPVFPRFPPLLFSALLWFFPPAVFSVVLPSCRRAP